MRTDHVCNSKQNISKHTYGNAIMIVWIGEEKICLSEFKKSTEIDIEMLYYGYNVHITSRRCRLIMRTCAWT